MEKKILNEHQRFKQDQADDSLFYSQPRFVYHLDNSFRTRLTNLYRAHLSKDSVLLDFMSSWDSHLPKEIDYKSVIGHGLNFEELSTNKRLDSYWIQNLNVEQNLPIPDNTIDNVLIVAGWQYLQYPEEIVKELARIVKPGGKLFISFSNRAFWQKASRIWVEGDYKDHFNYITTVLSAYNWNNFQYTIEMNKQGLLPFLGINKDPFFAVIAKNNKLNL